MNAPADRALGSLCKRGHDHQGTGMSMRYTSTGRGCIACSVEKAARRRDDVRKAPDAAVGGEQTNTQAVVGGTNRREPGTGARHSATGSTATAHAAAGSSAPRLRLANARGDELLDDDDLDLFVELDAMPGRQLRTENPLAWAALERVGAVSIDAPPHGLCTVTALVSAEELDL